MGNLIVQKEGLPNITGGKSGHGLLDDTGYYGAFGAGMGAYRWDTGGSGGYGGLFTFDASRSNSIYGRSNHVTPENYTLRIYKRVL